MEQAEPKRAPWGKRVLALALSLVFVLLLAEGAMRVRNRLKYGVGDSSVHVFTTHEESGLRIPTPGHTTPRLTIDGHGFRNPELDDPKPGRRLRMAFLGASTTFCAEASSDEATWPHRVCEALRKAHPDVEFDYLNAAVAGYTVEASRKNLRHRVRAFEPDVIVVYHGTNDLSKDTRELARARGLFDGKAEDPSWLARNSQLWYWVEKNLEVQARMRAAESGENRLEYDAGELARGFRERLATLLREAREAAPVVAVATFSTHVRREQDEKTRLKACNTSLYYMPYMSLDGLLDGFDAYNAAIRGAAGDAGAILVAGEHAIPGDPAHFADSVHLTDAGCEAMARRVVGALEGNPAFAKLLASKRGDS